MYVASLRLLSRILNLTRRGAGVKLCQHFANFRTVNIKDFVRFKKQIVKLQRRNVINIGAENDELVNRLRKLVQTFR